MRITLSSWQKKSYALILFGSIATLLLMPIASNTNLPALPDYLDHLYGIIQAKLALSDGQFPLRVARTNQESWIYPLFQFYSTSTYTVSGFINKLLPMSNPFIAYKITIWFALVIGGIYMNRLAFWLVESRAAAILASVVYLMAPYHILLINNFGAFNEIVALSILPVVLYYTFQRYYQVGNDTTLLQAALAWYLLATVHLLTFITTSFFVVLLVLLLTFNSLSQWRNLLSIGHAYCFACMLAMWQLAPIVLFGKYTQANQSFMDASAFYAFSPSLIDLLSPVALHSIRDSTYIIHPSLSFPIILGGGMCIYLYLRKRYSGNKRTDDWLVPLLIVYLSAFLLTWSPVNFWQWLPQSCRVIQSSLRLLGQVTWVGALLFAWTIAWLFQNKFQLFQVFIGVLIIVGCSLTWLTVPLKKINNFSVYLNHLRDSDFYLMDASKNPKFIHFIDTVLLDPSKFNGNVALQQGTAMFLPKPLFNAAYAPSILLRGDVFHAAHLRSQRFVVTVNNLIATEILKPGPFEWRIPLPIDHQSSMHLRFKIVDSENKVLVNPSKIIDMKEIIFHGFLNSSSLLDINKVQPSCRQEQETTLCEVSVASGIHLIELPVFYYPDMLSVSINGKLAPYFSVLLKNRLLTAVIPDPGKMNVIKIQFRGLVWANFMSGVAWQLWSLFLFFIIIQKMNVRYFRKAAYEYI